MLFEKNQKIKINLNIDDNKKFYVYRHFYKKNDYCENTFYIGKGQGKRILGSDRNEHWDKIVKKSNGKFYIEILEYFNEEKEALEYEKKLQSEYWSKGQCRGCKDLYLNINEKLDDKQVPHFKVFPMLIEIGDIRGMVKAKREDMHDIYRNGRVENKRVDSKEEKLVYVNGIEIFKEIKQIEIIDIETGVELVYMYTTDKNLEFAIDVNGDIRLCAIKQNICRELGLNTNDPYTCTKVFRDNKGAKFDKNTTKKNAYLIKKESIIESIMEQLE